MPCSPICCTIIFSDVPEPLIERYLEHADPADGYLTRLDGAYELVDARASETADWARQVELAAALVSEDMTALSFFAAGNLWGLALTHGGRPGILAAYDPSDAKMMEGLPNRLLDLEQTLDDYFTGQLDLDATDALFGALLEGAICADDAFDQLLTLLGYTTDWTRWSWYETIPEQLFLDPDLAARVIPLGEAAGLWEE